MKQKNQKRKGFAPRRGGKKGTIERDPFFEEESKKRRKVDFDDDIESVESDEEENGFSGGDEEEKEGEEAADEFAHETADERRKRLAEETLKRIREAKSREMEERDDDEDREEEDGIRDSLVAKALMQEQLEESGRVRRAIASRIQEPDNTDGFRFIFKHRQSVTAVALSDDDSRGFSASKDGVIAHWDVSSGKSEKYKWPSDEVLKSHGVKDPISQKRHSRETLALAVSFDGRYLASGGLDRHIHLWDTRTREHIQAFPGHRGPVSCLSFRQGTVELFSGSFDRTVKIWNAEDKSYISTLFGHQDEVLSIDSLRRERVLTVGRDRTMQLFKVPEESRLVFRAPASNLECCCFIGNDEFLSGSDNGTIALWTMLRKKPVYIVKNAHPVTYGEIITNGNTENGDQDSGNYNCSSAYSWVSSISVCRGSDLAASGAGNGFVRLWSIESESKAVQPLYELPMTGFVNSLAFAKSAQFLIAGVGQEPRLGRWGNSKSAKNGVAIHPLRLS